MSLLIVAFIVVFIDQLSKLFIRLIMEPGQSISLIENFFHLTYVRNPGGAFGIFPHSQTFLLIITAIVVAFIFFFQLEIGRDDFFIRILLGLFLGGTMGNFIDRVRLGYVIDFLDFRFWPVFNVADSSIVVGITLLVIYFLNILKTSKEKNASNID